MKRGTDARASTEIDASTGVQYIFVRFRAGPKKWNDLQPSYGSENAEKRLVEEQIIILYFFIILYLFNVRYVREYIKEKDRRIWTLLKNMDESLIYFFHRSMTFLGKELYSPIFFIF